MKIVAAPNALKGSLSAWHAARAIAEGALRALPDAEVVQCPVADGGDGTREVLQRALGGTSRCARVSDPLGRPREVEYGVADAGRTALLDLATASGLALLAPAERDPLVTTTFGTGELIRIAMADGCRRIVLGLGGSATVDGGLGLLGALGITALDAQGHVLARGGGSLTRLARFDASSADPLLAGAEFCVLCDVENPLLGPTGAARVYGPQKGATPTAVLELEAGLDALARVLARDHRAADGPRAGAAGGVAASLASVLGAELCSRIDWVLDRLGFEELVRGAELVITAEGQLDAQSASNKAPYGVARWARRWNVPTLALAGSISGDFVLGTSPFAAALCISQRCLPWPEAGAHAAEWLASASEQAMRLLTLLPSNPSAGGDNGRSPTPDSDDRLRQ